MASTRTRCVLIFAGLLTLTACGSKSDSAQRMSAATESTSTTASFVTTTTTTTTSSTVPVATVPPKIIYTYSVRPLGEFSSDFAEFRSIVAATFADSRGWSFGGLVQFRQVEAEGDFTIWLASSTSMRSFGYPCSATYSCRNGRNVIINEERWKNGGFLNMDLADYRQMVINHETGHWLGLGHRSCSGAGRPAHLMQQQSKGGAFLGSCTPNAWPTEEERNAVARDRNLTL